MSISAVSFLMPSWSESQETREEVQLQKPCSPELSEPQETRKGIQLQKPWSLERSESQETGGRIQLQMFPQPCLPKLIVDQLVSITGSVDVYSWYEGPRGLLSKEGATFMKREIFEPLYQSKKDAKLYPYSLIAWDFKGLGNVTKLPFSTPHGDEINCINTTVLECFYSSSFFRTCTQVSQEGGLYASISAGLREKKWLFDLSSTRPKTDIKVTDFFNNQSSLFDCIGELDMSFAYSLMQYIEGYYLIRESVRKGLEKGQKKIEVAFVLPNDESKYYINLLEDDESKSCLDLLEDIEKMLQLDFKEKLAGVEVNISFQFFRYGNSLKSRPYIGREGVRPEEIGFYFDYPTRQLSPSQSILNGWY